MVVPDMSRRGLEELLARLFNVSVAPKSKSSNAEIKEAVECLRIPLDVESMDQSSVERVRVKLSRCYTLYYPSTRS